MAKLGAEIVALYQAYFDNEVTHKNQPKAECCAAIFKIATAVAGGSTKKEAFKEKANNFPGFSKAHKDEFDHWTEEAFANLFDAFKAIFDIDDPLEDCAMPDAVLDARFRWAESKQYGIEYVVLESLNPKLVVVTIFGK